MLGFARRNPKLIPLWALWKAYRILGLNVTLAQLASLLPHDLYDVRRVNDIRFGVRLSQPIDYETVYEIPVERLLRPKPRRGDVVVDAGAHIGGYSLRYSKLVGEDGRVVAFEPHPDNRRILRWNVGLNRASNILVRQEALADFTGQARMRVSLSSISHSLVERAGRGRQVGEIFVPTIRLDDVGLNRLDLLKIDVEGYEYKLLRGGEKTISSFRPKMRIEIHNAHSSDCKVCNWLGDKGYAMRTIQSLREDHTIEAW